jgi:microcystin-dependent protein
MSEQYLGQIRILGSTFPPVGFLTCAGQTLSIQQYNALYSLLGIQFGGDARANFNLPDLRGRTFLGTGTYNGNTYPVGQNNGAYGTPTVTLKADQVPAHTHGVNVSTGKGSSPPVGNTLSQTQLSEKFFAVPGTGSFVPLANQLGLVGDGVAHNNMQPYLALNFVIATIGYYPPRP